MRTRRLRVPRHIEELIRGFHPETKRKVRAALTSVVAEPTVGDDLRDRLSGFRRVRIGRWRIVYRERRGLIEVFAVGPRATVYSDLVARLERPRAKHQTVRWERSGPAQDVGRALARVGRKGLLSA